MFLSQLFMLLLFGGYKIDEYNRSTERLETIDELFVPWTNKSVVFCLLAFLFMLFLLGTRSFGLAIFNKTAKEATAVEITDKIWNKPKPVRWIECIQLLKCVLLTGTHHLLILTERQRDSQYYICGYDPWWDCFLVSF